MSERYVYASLTRNADLEEKGFAVEKQPAAEWNDGDYVIGEVLDTPGERSVELRSGRMMEVAEGDVVVGALGKRYATLSLTGDWADIGPDGTMHAMTSAGLFGKMDSHASNTPQPMTLAYRGHAMRDGHAVRMADFVTPVKEQAFTTPTIVLFGTSMSAGKTTAARIVTRRLKGMGYAVLGAKLSGAGRYRDVLSIHDAGADWIFDFVDAGLPSTVYPEDAYRAAIRQLLAQMATREADVAVIEIGASPLEPYNGAIAIEEIRDTICFAILCASDPYAVVGVQAAFDTLPPDLVTGIATNTEAGIDLIGKLTEVPALNIRDQNAHAALDDMLREALDVKPVAERTDERGLPGTKPTHHREMGH